MIRRTWSVLGAILIALSLVVGLSGSAAAQGPDVPFKEPEQILVPAPNAKDAPSKEELEGQDGAAPNYYVTGIRIQKLSYPQFAPLEGWQFTVYDAANQQVAQGTTNSSGYADFFSLPPGNYKVTETVQPNWTAYYPSSAQVWLRVYPGYVTFFRFYNRGTVTPPPAQTGTLSVCKRDVSNPAAPVPVSDWPISFARSGGGPSGTVVTQGTSGCRTIANLPEGNYTVTEASRPGWEFVQVAPDNDGPNNLSTVVPVAANQTTTVVFDNRRTVTQTGGAIRICKLDVTSANERTVAGWPVAIQVAGSGAYRSAYTGYDGCVTFRNLTPGSYSVEEGRPAGWQFVSVDPDDGQAPDHRTTVQVAGSDTVTVTFRNRRIVPASLTVCKRLLSGPNEYWVSGYQMTLRREDNTPIGSGYTSHWAQGCLTFGNLTPGTYIVEEASYPGWEFVSVSPDEDGNAADPRAKVTVGNGENKQVVFKNRRTSQP